jgi:hypothetical protein
MRKIIIVVKSLFKKKYYSVQKMLAVTVWEITTAAKERPYSSMNDTQVILNADHFFYADGKEVH